MPLPTEDQAATLEAVQSEGVDREVGSFEMNHKAKRPRRARAGCKMCKPHKWDRRTAHRLRDKRQDEARGAY